MSLFDPLAKLKYLSARLRIVTDERGLRRLELEFASTVRWADRRKAEAIARRFERLILMQLDVEEGCLPRTVQQLVAGGKLLVVNGRYMTPEQAAKLRDGE